MKFFRRILILFSFFTIIFLSFANGVSAQLSRPLSDQQQLTEPFQQQSPSATSGDPVDPCGDPVFDPYCPIDGYLYILIGIAVLYGIKKATQKKRIVENE